MTPNELRDSLYELGMARRTLAATLGVHLVTVNRWATGALSVPSYAAAYLHACTALARERGQPMIPLAPIARGGKTL